MSEPRCASYYAATIHEETEYPRLEGEHRVDVAVIGGGFTGVNTALELAELQVAQGVGQAHAQGELEHPGPIRMPEAAQR